MSENYVCKSAAVFRKNFPEYIEIKKDYGNKKLAVFFDFSILADINDMPDDILAELKTAASNQMNRINTVYFGNEIISETDCLKYYIDLDGDTYNVINDKTGKLMYAVIKITGVRYAAYDIKLYDHSKYPVKTNEYNWRTQVNTPIYDLYYSETA